MTNPDTSPNNGGFIYEDVAKIAQRFLAERPVVVLGTGATIPHGLPSMSSLADSRPAAAGSIPGAVYRLLLP